MSVTKTKIVKGQVDEMVAAGNTKVAFFNKSVQRRLLKNQKIVQRAHDLREAKIAKLRVKATPPPKTEPSGMSGGLTVQVGRMGLEEISEDGVTVSDRTASYILSKKHLNLHGNNK